MRETEIHNSSTTNVVMYEDNVQTLPEKNHKIFLKIKTVNGENKLIMKAKK